VYLSGIAGLLPGSVIVDAFDFDARLAVVATKVRIQGSNRQRAGLWILLFSE
jgi:hypothetical protein